MQKEEDHPLDCDLLHFFELGSVHYTDYIVNIRLPSDEDKNRNIGKLKDMTLTVSS